MVPKNLIPAGLFFLGKGEEAVAGILIDYAVGWEFARGTLGAFFGFGEKVDSLLFATTKSNFGFV